MIVRKRSEGFGDDDSRVFIHTWYVSRHFFFDSRNEIRSSLVRRPVRLVRTYVRELVLIESSTERFVVREISPIYVNHGCGYVRSLITVSKNAPRGKENGFGSRARVALFGSLLDLLHVFLQVELLQELLVAVSDRYFGHAGHIGDLALRALLAVEER